MGRPSKRDQRRVEILAAFARVLAEHGYVGATVVAVGAEAGISPGLIHHHFHNKDEMLSELLGQLRRGFQARTRLRDQDSPPLEAYIDAAIALDERSDVLAARCWVGIFAEAMRNPALFKMVRRLVDSEIAAIERRSRGDLGSEDAAAVLAFIIGALVLGAFAPRKTAGFAAPALRRFVSAMGGRTS